MLICVARCLPSSSILVALAQQRVAGGLEAVCHSASEELQPLRES